MTTSNPALVTICCSDVRSNRVWATNGDTRLRVRDRTRRRNWNSANDFIRFGQAGKVATNDRYEQELGFLALQIVQNSSVFINTPMLQEVLDGTDNVTLSGRDRDALTPLFYTHVNPDGRFELDMNSRNPYQWAMYRA